VEISTRGSTGEGVDTKKKASTRQKEVMLALKGSIKKRSGASRLEGWEKVDKRRRSSTITQEGMKKGTGVKVGGSGWEVHVRSLAKKGRIKEW